MLQSPKGTASLLVCLLLILSSHAWACDVRAASLSELRVSLAQKKTTSVEAVSDYLTRIQDSNERLHAIIATNPNARRPSAQSSCLLITLSPASLTRRG